MYQQQGAKMPKTFLSTYKPPNSVTSDKISRNKKRKLKKKAKRKKELLEKQMKEFTSIEDDNQSRDQDSLKALKDFKLDYLDDDADACGASLDEEESIEQTKLALANNEQIKMEIESKQDNDLNTLTSSSTIDSNNSDNLPKNKRISKEEVTIDNDIDSLNSNQINHNTNLNHNEESNSCKNSNNQLNECTANLIGLNNCTTSMCEQGNETTSNLSNSEIVNNFLIIFEEIKKATQRNANSIVRKPDPSREVCKIGVKIADLGNGCWVVSVSA